MHTLTWISTCLPKQTSTQTKPQTHSLQAWREALETHPLSSHPLFSSPYLRSHFLTCAHWCDYERVSVTMPWLVYQAFPAVFCRAKKKSAERRRLPTQTHWLLRHTATLRKREREEKNDGMEGKEKMRAWDILVYIWVFWLILWMILRYYGCV